MALLESELIYYYIFIQHVNPCATVSPHLFLSGYLFTSLFINFFIPVCLYRTRDLFFFREIKYWVYYWTNLIFSPHPILSACSYIVLFAYLLLSILLWILPGSGVSVPRLVRNPNSFVHVGVVRLKGVRFFLDERHS